MNTDVPFQPPKLTAEQALMRLLELIRGSDTVSDFTAERFEEVMQVQVTRVGHSNGFGAQVASQWGLVSDFGTAGQRTRLDLSFWPMPPPAPGKVAPPMTAICGIDFNRFTTELEAMGFIRGSSYDSLPPWPGPGPRPHEERGAWMYDYFNRPGMGIEVYPEGERAWTQEEGSGRTCVRNVRVY